MKTEIGIPVYNEDESIELLNSQKQMAHTFGYVIMNSEPPLSQFMSNKFYIELMKKK